MRQIFEEEMPKFCKELKVSCPKSREIYPRGQTEGAYTVL